MPAPSSVSALAICLRCQFRYSHRLRLGRPFTTSSRHSAVTFPETQLLILQSLAPRKSRHRFGIPEPEVLGAEALEGRSKELLTYEVVAAMDATGIDISLRKPGILRVSKERYQQLGDELSKAFLRDQLDEYYHSDTPDGKIIPHLKRATKRGLIRGILLDRWGVVIADDIAKRVDVLVEKEIKSSRRDIFFMLGGEGKALREWSHRYQARIRINVEREAIIVQASQQNMEGLEESMEGLLVGLIEEDLDMSWVSRLGAFNETFITPIATITNTFIERINKDSSKLRITGLRRESIQDARRLLFTSLDLQLRSSYSLLYGVPQGQGDDTGALFPISEGFSLPWRFRGTDWARWRNIRRNVRKRGAGGKPLAKVQAFMRKVGEDTPEPLADLEGVRRLLDMPVGEQSTVPDGASTSTEYEAVLGYLLHDSSGSEALSKPQGLLDFIKDERLRVLCNDFPGLASLTQDLKPIADSGDSVEDSQSPPPPAGPRPTPYRSCILKFLPSPWARPDSFERYPALEMKMEMDQESGEPQPLAMAAVHSEAIADVLFPSASCDVRFRRRTTILLDLFTTDMIPTPGVSASELKRFMSESSLNPLLHVEIRASPRIAVSLPTWMILGPKSSSTPPPPPSSPEDDDKSNDIIPPQPLEQVGEKKEHVTDVDYIFAGLEYRRDLRFDWKGIALHQTLVQGGVTGGRKTETKLVWREQGEEVEEEEGEGEIDGGRPEGIEEVEAVKRVPFATFAEKTAELVDALGNYIATKAWSIGGGKG